MNKIGVAALMIAWNNEDSSLVRLQRDLLPALRFLRDKLDSQVIVMDNSENRSNRLADAVAACEFPAQYHWFEGANLMSGPVYNLAVSMTRCPFLLYVCTQHGRAYDPSWPWDLLCPLINDRSVAMTGTLADAGSPTEMGFDATIPELHVQGGVFAARTEAIRAQPYPDGQYAHWGTDVYECFALQDAGYKLVDVPTIKSVWRAKAGEGTWKYVHENED